MSTDNNLESFLYILDNLDDPTVTMDDDFRVVFWSRAAERLFGTEARNAKGRLIWDLFPDPDPDHSDFRKKIHRQIVESGNWRGLVEQRTRWGQHVWVDWSLSRLAMPEWGFNGYISILKDVTVRHLENLKRQASEEMLRAVFETATDSIFIKDLEGRYVRVNPVVEALYGMPSSEIVGRCHDDLLGGFSDGSWKMEDERAFSGETVDVEQTLHVKSGTRRMHTVKVPLRRADGRIFGLCGFGRDITPRYEAESALRASEKRERENAHNLKILSDAAWRFVESISLETFHLRVAEQLLRLTHARAIVLTEFDEKSNGLICREIVCPEAPREMVTQWVGWDPIGQSFPLDDPSSREHLLEGRLVCLEGGLDELAFCRLGRERSRELEAQLGVGLVFSMGFARKNRLFGSAGIVLGEGAELNTQVVETFINQASLAYQRCLAEQEADRLHEQLEQSRRLEAVGRLAGGIAHDFNNLLTSITGNVELALMDLSAGLPLEDMLRDIGRAAERAAQLTQQLLAFSRKQIIQTEPVDVNLLLQRQARVLSWQLGKNIEVRVTGLADPAWMLADIGQIEAVLVQLAGNSQEAMPEGGRLDLRAFNHVVLRGDGEAGVLPGEYIAIEISDSGFGMDSDTLTHIFDPFFTTRPKHEGRGLGLSTAFGILQQHSGTIIAKSIPGKGSRFTLFIPAAEPA